MEILTKELLSEVLGLKVFKSELQNNELVYTFDESCGLPKPKFRITRINIHELAHKCKEWALQEKYTLTITLTKTDGSYCYFREHGDFNEKQKYSLEKTEFEAVTKTCQWILDNKETK